MLQQEGEGKEEEVTHRGRVCTIAQRRDKITEFQNKNEKQKNLPEDAPTVKLPQ